MAELESSTANSEGEKDAGAGSQASVFACPERPHQLPTAARWEPVHGRWEVGTRDASGRAHGDYQLYRPDGSLWETLQYEHGSAEGPFKRYHRSGELAREGNFEEGKLHGDVVAHAGTRADSEPLRACCVPRNAVTMRARYDRGACLGESFYNREGKLLLDDGTVHPERPHGITDSARFEAHGRQWIAGSYGDKFRRTGTWRFWSEAGALKEEHRYEAGKLHGPRRYYAEDARLDREYRYVCGELDGSFFDRSVKPGLYADPRIAEVSGAYHSGKLTGRWVFKDARGRNLHECDFGTIVPGKLSAHPVFESSSQDTERWWRLSSELRQKRHLGLALCAAARAAGSVLSLAVLSAGSGSQEASSLLAEEHGRELRQLIEQNLVMLRPEAGFHRLAGIKKRTSSVEDEVLELIDAWLYGADSVTVLHRLASVFMGQPRAALDLINGALCLCLAGERERPSPTALRPTELGPQGMAAPPNNVVLGELYATRVLILCELGQPSAARRDVHQVDGWSEASGEELSSYVNALFPHYDFWPSRLELVEEASPELDGEVAQSPGAVKSTFEKCAARLKLLRGAIIEKLGSSEPDWVVPDLGGLTSTRSAPLESYSFDAEQNGEVDHIVVDERIHVDGVRMSSLLRMARLEWTALTWLCWAAGLDRVSVPERLEPRPEFARALTTAFIYHYVSLDQKQTGGLRAKMQKAPSFEWEGIPIERAPSLFVDMAEQEFREMRAVLFYLADETCRSVWQDDLRP